MRMYTEAEFHRPAQESIPEREPPRCYRRQPCQREEEERMRWDSYAVALILMSALLAASLWVVHS
jgi:hypothetical protein